MRNHFAKSDKVKGVIRFNDEWTTMSAAEALIPAVNQGYSDKIAFWAMFGDDRQIGRNPIAGQGPKNTLNEFLANARISLSKRLVSSGFPAHRMAVQNRMHPILFALVNEISYDCAILSSAFVTAAAIHQAVLQCIKGCHGAFLEEHSCTDCTKGVVCCRRVRSGYHLLGCEMVIYAAHAQTYSFGRALGVEPGSVMRTGYHDKISISLVAYNVDRRTWSSKTGKPQSLYSNSRLRKRECEPKRRSNKRSNNRLFRPGRLNRLGIA